MKQKKLNFNYFYGQNKILEHLQIAIKAAAIKKTTLSNIFLFGPSGCGKTTLAFLIAKNLKQKLHFFYGYYFKTIADIFHAFSKVKNNEVVFIDEIHRLKSSLYEHFFEIIDFNQCSLVFGKNSGSKIVKIKLAPFTLIVASTHLHKIKEAFLNRFLNFYQFENYKDLDLYLILKNLATKNNLKFEKNALECLVDYTKKNPRIAYNIFSQIHDYTIVKKISIISKNNLKLILNKLVIYNKGINNIDLKYLQTLKNSPKSLATICQITNFSPLMIINKIEPFLIKEELIFKSTRGRVLSSKGYDLLTKILCNKQEQETI